MTSLLILGGSVPYLYVIKRCLEMDIRTVVADRNPHSAARPLVNKFYPIDITDQKAILAVAHLEKVHGILALNDYGVRTAAFVAEALGVPGISLQTAENATSKLAMRRIWEKHHIPSARFHSILTLEDAEAAAADIGYPVIVKPACSIGGGSRGVSLVQNDTFLPAAIKFAQEFYDEKLVLVEEYLKGREFSVETLTWHGNTHLISVGENEKLPPPYRVNKKIIYPAQLNSTQRQQIDQVIKDAVAALEINNGAAHVEFCLTDHGPKLIELGARCGGGGIPEPITRFSTGIDLADKMIGLALGKEPGSLQATQNRSCVYHFLTPNPGTIKAMEGIEQAKALPGILDITLFKRPGDQISPIRTGLDRVGAIIAGGRDTTEAINIAMQAEDMIKFRYCAHEPTESESP